MFCCSAAMLEHESFGDYYSHDVGLRPYIYSVGEVAYCLRLKHYLRETL